MSRYQTGDIKCSCGNMVPMELYESVNVTVDPKLLSKVKSRKINSFYCDKCGEKSELAYQFLYVDMKNNYWVWVYPEAARKNKDAIEKELQHTGNMQNIADKLGIGNPKIVFGYNELFEIIDPSLKDNGSNSKSQDPEIEYFFAKNVDPFLSKDELINLYTTACDEYDTEDLQAAERKFMNDYISSKNGNKISSNKILELIIKIANKRLVKLQKESGLGESEIDHNILFSSGDKDETSVMFIPKRLEIHGLPKLNNFPLNILFSSVNRNSETIDPIITAEYIPDIGSFTEKAKIQKLKYIDKSDKTEKHWAEVLFDTSNGSYTGHKYIGTDRVGSAIGKDWNTFFIHFSALGEAVGNKEVSQ